MRDDIDRFEEIYHLASPVGSLGILEKSGRIAGDILSLADKAARIASYSKSRLLYVSSSEVYGRDGRHQESSEQRVPCKRGPRMEYALAKLTAEHALLNRAAEGSFELRIVRPFNAMGEWQSSTLGFVVPMFFEAALAGRDLHVFGTGKQIRSFCHVRDLVNGMIQVQATGQPDNVYNIGHPDNVISIEELALLIRSLSANHPPDYAMWIRRTCTATVILKPLIKCPTSLKSSNMRDGSQTSDWRVA